MKYEIQQKNNQMVVINEWGEYRDSNPSITEPQSAVLTPSPYSPNVSN